MDLRKGISLKICAALCTVIMGACIAALHGEIPIGEVVFFRSAGAFLPLIALLLIRRQLRQQIVTRDFKGHVIRSVSGTCGMFFGFLALSYLPLADATALSYAAPLFTVVLAAIVLKEVVRLYRWTAVGIGLVGVLVMLSPHASLELASAQGERPNELVGGIFGIIAASFAAISTIQIRHMAKSESPGAIVFYFSLITTLIGLSTIGFGWKMPDTGQLTLLIGAGLSGGLAQMLITSSLRHAQASLLAPFDYTTMIWALIVGYLAMGEVPLATTLCGALMVVSAGLFTIWRERQLARRAAAVAKVAKRAKAV